ncbi:MAG: hypothetical protein ACOY93_13495 [Bacillota bacterium]
MIVDRKAVRRLSPQMESRMAQINPTAELAILLADGDLTRDHDRPVNRQLIKPMSVERLIAAGGKLSEEEQARVRYHQLGDLVAVAKELGRSEEWVHQACAWDIEQRRSAS